MRPKENEYDYPDSFKIVYIVLASLTLFFAFATIACGIILDLLSPISLACLLLAVLFGIFTGIAYMLRFRMNAF